jgi:hypothetical protein
LPLEDEPVIVIQIVAALLLVLGSGLLFHALVALDTPSRPRALSHGRFDRAGEDVSDQGLRRAA